MGIYDRDWYREKPNKQSYFTSHDSDWYYEKSNNRPPSVGWTVFLISFLLGMLIVLILRFIVPPSENSKPSTTVYIPPTPVYNPLETIYPPPAFTSPEQKRSRVLHSTPTSQTIQYYEKKGVKYVQAEVNGVPVEVMIDTGASYVSLNSTTIQRLGISTFSSKSISDTAGGYVNTYLFKCASAKVGTMEVKNIDCAYLPTLSDNLLGNSFLSHFSYSFDEEDNTITLTCNGYSLETSPLGIVEINGKKYLHYSSGQLVEVR